MTVDVGSAEQLKINKSSAARKLALNEGKWKVIKRKKKNVQSSVCTVS